MKKILLHVTNWVGYYIAIGTLGDLWGKLFGYLFEGFLSDESYAAEHPKKYLLGAIGITLLAIVSGLIVIWAPLNYLMKKIDNKIEDHFEEDENEWD